MTSHVDEQQALEAFVLDNPDLEKLEGLLEAFNLFEAIGVVRQELRHSDFLAFLLDPNQNHGLGDAFLKRFLREALGRGQVEAQAVTPLDIALWSLDGVEVRREWRNVDMLLLDEDHELAVIVENKVTSGEHSDQLRRYWRTVRRHYPQLHVVGVYLTPDGDPPSDERYAAVDYGLIRTLVEELVEQRASTLGPDVRLVMEHYAQLLRRHIMSDSDIAKLCRRIYRKHKRALDLIYEHRPDLQEEIRLLLEQLIADAPQLTTDYVTKTYVRFIPREWDSPLLQDGEGWTPSGRMLLLEAINEAQRLHLKAKIGPGPQQVRERLYQMAADHPPFQTYQKLGARHTTIFSRDLLSASDYEDAMVDEMKEKIRAGWRQFLERDLPALTEVIREQAWLWPERPAED